MQGKTRSGRFLILGGLWNVFEYLQGCVTGSVGQSSQFDCFRALPRVNDGRLIRPARCLQPPFESGDRRVCEEAQNPEIAEPLGVRHSALVPEPSSAFEPRGIKHHHQCLVTCTHPKQAKGITLA